MSVYKFYLEDEFIVLTTDSKQLQTWQSEYGFLYTSIDGEIRLDATGKDFAWDGCSPKVKFLDMLIGTPDGATDLSTNRPKTYFASLFHDAMYQNKSTIPLSRYDVDQIFLKMLKFSDFKLAKLYYLAVRLFGGVMGKWKTKKSVLTDQYVIRTMARTRKMNRDGVIYNSQLI